mmetsp:Transcript_44031/g.110646  ORF Transcript_44031/g.110646 Transcript_44031/m.110646 type:complete len:213 (-) Transcript_44031:82-720(-)
MAATQSLMILTRALPESLPRHSIRRRSLSPQVSSHSADGKADPQACPGVGYKNTFKALAAPLHVSSNAVMLSSVRSKSERLVNASRCAVITTMGDERSCFAIFPRARKIELSPVCVEDAKYAERTRCAASSMSCALERKFLVAAVANLALLACSGALLLNERGGCLGCSAAGAAALAAAVLTLRVARRWIARTTPCRTKSNEYGVGWRSNNS